MSSLTGTKKPARTLRARPQTACFVCGQDNPRGLRIPYQCGNGGEVTATWTPSTEFEGFRGIVHGGLVSTVLDEAMSKAVAAAGREALTAELRVRFRRPVASAGAYLIRGWVLDCGKRLIKTEASFSDPEGSECAHAWAIFLPLNGGNSRARFAAERQKPA